MAAHLQQPPLDIACALEGVCISMDSFHISRDGAVGTLSAAGKSTLVLDTAFHIAGAWSQQFTGKVALPVGYSQRLIIKATKRRETYFFRVLPLSVEGNLLRFDAWIYDHEGRPCEAILNLRMSAHKRAMAPASDPLLTIQEGCKGMSVVELKSLLPFSYKTLTRQESALTHTQMPKRKLHFIGARVALKRLARILYPDDVPHDPSAIETIASDRTHPACSPEGFGSMHHCSVSHDDRFVIAVAGLVPIGVDVEKLTRKALRGARLFMSDSERRACIGSLHGEEEDAIRVWTIKEAAAKALDIPLSKARARVTVLEIGNSTSVVKSKGLTLETRHAVVDDHLFTMVSVPEQRRG